MTTTAMVSSSTSILERYIAEIRRSHPVLPVEEVWALARQYRATKDRAIAHRIVASHLMFVVQMAYAFHHQFGVGLLDLIQEGNIGLLTALKGFDPDRGYTFLSYAKWWIRYHMQCFVLRNAHSVSVPYTAYLRTLFFQMSAAQHQLRKTHQEEPTSAEVAAELGASEQDVEQMRALQAPPPRPPRWVAGEDRDPLDLLPHTADMEDDILDRDAQRQLQEDVQRALQCLDPKELAVMQGRYAEDLRFPEIGARLGVTRQRVDQLEKRARRKLRAALSAC